MVCFKVGSTILNYYRDTLQIHWVAFKPVKFNPFMKRNKKFVDSVRTDGHDAKLSQVSKLQSSLRIYDKILCQSFTNHG